MFVSADDMNSSHEYGSRPIRAVSEWDSATIIWRMTSRQNIRDKYKEHIAKMFQLAGYDEATAQKQWWLWWTSKLVWPKLPFTSGIAWSSPTIIRWIWETLKKNFPTFDWDAYFTASGLNDWKKWISVSLQPWKEVADVINTVSSWRSEILSSNGIWSMPQPLSKWWFCSTKLRLLWQNNVWQERNAASLETCREHRRRCAGWSSRTDVCRKILPAAAKERMVGLVKNLQTSLGERIKGFEWMSEPTKEKALLENWLPSMLKSVILINGKITQLWRSKMTLIGQISDVPTNGITMTWLPKPANR